MKSYLGPGIEQLPDELRDISEGCRRRGFFHRGPMSGMMHTAIDQLVHCPFTGPARRLYMESRIIELIAHKIAQLHPAGDAPSGPGSALHPQDIAQIRRARDILCSDLENPPKLIELARSAGLNHGKLNLGFRQIFGTTVFGYLRQARLQESKRLLETGDMNVTEVALSVGYNSLPSFSRAFTECFGMPPVECLKSRSRRSGRGLQMPKMPKSS